MKLYKRKVKFRRTKRPEDFGQMIISVDDGWVEWQYKIQTEGTLSIDSIVRCISKKFNAPILKSKIRTEFKNVKQD